MQVRGRSSRFTSLGAPIALVVLIAGWTGAPPFEAAMM